MVRYGIIFKRKNAKIWQGSQVAKPNVSKKQLEAFVRKHKKKGYVIKVVPATQIVKLKNLYKKIASIKRTTKRKKRTVRQRRPKSKRQRFKAKRQRRLKRRKK